jgi:3-methyl-2-oxobutanoate hydroxymethyltransferase
MARGLEEAGAFAMVLECVPAALAALISAELTIPTIGIGAGVACDGQVLVTHDLLGMFEKFIPHFVKSYANLAPQISSAVQDYKREVREGRYPDDEHSFKTSLAVEDILDK